MSIRLYIFLVQMVVWRSVAYCCNGYGVRLATVSSRLRQQAVPLSCNNLRQVQSITHFILHQESQNNRSCKISMQRGVHRLTGMKNLDNSAAQAPGKDGLVDVLYSWRRAVCVLTGTHTSTQPTRIPNIYPVYYCHAAVRLVHHSSRYTN